jgi:uncharacterized integral membrane protein
MSNNSIFEKNNSGTLFSDEIAINEPEIENKYSIDGKEIIVLTGRNPKCPDGYKIIKTNLNKKDSDINVIICGKNIDINQKVEPAKSNHGLDWQDPLALSVSNKDYSHLEFPFIERDDSFIGADDTYKHTGNIELWSVILLFILVILYIVNNTKYKKINIMSPDTSIIT